MNRLCIYMTYSSKHIIHEYVGYMLKELKKNCTDIVFVCNFSKIEDGLEYIEPFVSTIICRENIGFDGGAYKDCLFDYIGWNEVYKYDELVLMNDSFFGPIYDLELFFKKAEQEDCDYWGMTRAPEGRYEEIQYSYNAHIQSYFIVFKSRLLHDKRFYDFWERFKYPETYDEAIKDYEHALNYYLEGNGFRSMAFTDLWGMDFKKNENPYRLYTYEMVSKYGYPFIKKKSLSINNAGFNNALQAVYYIDSNLKYPTRFLWEFLESQFYYNNADFNKKTDLEVFYDRYSQIYIYGAGVCGKNLAIYFQLKEWNFQDFLITNPIDEFKGMLTIDQIECTLETGIIISVKKEKMANEIARHIKNYVKKEQIFMIANCAVV